MYILGAFLIGGVVGFATDRALSKPGPLYFDSQDELARVLGFSAKQQAKVDSIWAWRRDRYRETQAPVRVELDRWRDSARILILNELDESQKAKFFQLIERNERLADSLARVRGDKR